MQLGTHPIFTIQKPGECILEYHLFMAAMTFIPLLFGMQFQFCFSFVSLAIEPPWTQALDKKGLDDGGEPP